MSVELKSSFWRFENGVGCWEKRSEMKDGSFSVLYELVELLDSANMHFNL